MHLLLYAILLFVPMMVLRANAEDRLLKEADKTAFAVYNRDVPQLVPQFGKWMSLLLRSVVIGMLGYSLILQDMGYPRFLLLVIAHFLTGIIVKTPKVRFSFINKSIVMLLIYGGMQFYRPIFWMFYVILFFDIWGLFGNCPCMLIYQKYNRCPCFDIIKSFF
jgi:hypothetical protein